MFGGLYNIVFTDYSGRQEDLIFLNQDAWLKDAAVCPYVFKAHCEWRIALTFAWTKNPMRLICRYMPDGFSALEKAQTFARYYQRTIQKDARGFLQISANDFHINYN